MTLACSTSLVSPMSDIYMVVFGNLHIMEIKDNIIMVGNHDNLAAYKNVSRLQVIVDCLVGCVHINVLH